jgi:hypothetical protein
LGDKDLGPAPVVVDVPAGETLKLRIAYKGYRDEIIEVNGSEEKLAVKLDSAKRPAKWRPPAKEAPVVSTPPPKKKPSIGGGEIVNPWE